MSSILWYSILSICFPERDSWLFGFQLHQMGTIRCQPIIWSAKEKHKVMIEAIVLLDFDWPLVQIIWKPFLTSSLHLSWEQQHIHPSSSLFVPHTFVSWSERQGYLYFPQSVYHIPPYHSEIRGPPIFLTRKEFFFWLISRPYLL